MNYRIFCLMLILPTLIASAESGEGEKVKPVQKVRPGTRYVTLYREYEGLLSPDTLRPEFSSTRLRCLFKQEASKPDAEGLTTITMTPLHLQVRRHREGDPQRAFDYDSATTPADSAIGKVFQPFLKSQTILVRDKDHDLRSLKITGNPWTKMAKTDHPLAATIAYTCVHKLGSKSITVLLDLPRFYLPDHPMKQNNMRISPEVPFYNPAETNLTRSLQVKASEITKDKMVMTLWEKRVRRAGRNKRIVSGPKAGTIIFDRNTGTVTDCHVSLAYRSRYYPPPEGAPDRTPRDRLVLRRTISDKLPKLKPLPTLPKSMKESVAKTPAKMPTTKPAAMPPAAPEKKAVAPTEEQD